MSSDLNTLLADGLIDEVLGLLKTGKEAELWLVRHGEEILAAKTYKDRATRSFKNNAGYKEGRQVRNSRTARAIAKGSKFGREAEEDAWKSAESDALFKLHGQGVRVPAPVAFYEGVLLMQLVCDAEGQPAPRLIDAFLSADEAAAVYAELRTQAIKMLCADLIHGDLSPYNVLIGAAGPVIIDFPQVIGAAHNSQAAEYFTRDLENLRTHLMTLAPRLTTNSGDAAEIWRAYVRRELLPDFVPSGKPPPPPPPPREPRPQQAAAHGKQHGQPRGQREPRGEPRAQGHKENRAPGPPAHSKERAHGQQKPQQGVPRPPQAAQPQHAAPRPQQGPHAQQGAPRPQQGQQRTQGQQGARAQQGSSRPQHGPPRTQQGQHAAPAHPQGTPPRPPQGNVQQQRPPQQGASPGSRPQLPARPRPSGPPHPGRPHGNPQPGNAQQARPHGAPAQANAQQARPQAPRFQRPQPIVQRVQRAPGMPPPSRPSPPPRAPAAEPKQQGAQESRPPVPRREE